MLLAGPVPQNRSFNEEHCFNNVFTFTDKSILASPLTKLYLRETIQRRSREFRPAFKKCNEYNVESFHTVLCAEYVQSIYHCILCSSISKCKHEAQ